MAAVQDGPTSIRVSWTPSIDAAGYRIHYTGSNSDQNTLNILGQSINSYTLTGLENGETYTVYIMTKSLQGLLGSPVVAGNVGLGRSILNSVHCYSHTNNNIVYFNSSICSNTQLENTHYLYLHHNLCHCSL